MTDLDLTPPFERQDVEILKSEDAYRGFFSLRKVTLRHRCFEGGWSRELSREVFVRGLAIGVLLYDPEHDLVGLVEQFRVGALDEPAGPWCLEVVAGIDDHGESAEEVAHREILEETGLEAEKLLFICDYLASPGGTTEKLHLYCGLTNLKGVGGVHGLPEEGEDIRLRVFDATKVFEVLYNGRFNNAATLICLQWLQLNRSRLRGFE